MSKVLRATCLAATKSNFGHSEKRPLVQWPFLFAQFQQFVDSVPAANRKECHASGFIVNVVRQLELRSCDLDFVGVGHVMQCMFGNTWIGVTFF